MQCCTKSPKPGQVPIFETFLYSFVKGCINGLRLYGLWDGILDCYWVIFGYMGWDGRDWLANICDELGYGPSVHRCQAWLEMITSQRAGYNACMAVFA